MNYEPNTVHWPRGSTVIHDADAKHPLALMRIVGYTRDGLVKCQYINRKMPRKIYINEFRNLHDPDKFGMNSRWGDYSQESLNRIQDEWERVKRWNFHYEVGTMVITTSADGGFTTRTTRKAFIDKGGCAFVWLYHGGLWALKHVQPITP